MRRSRAATGVFAALLVARAVAAAEPWYEAYEAALKAVAARQWSVAETKLKAAIKDGPRPGRRVRTYGMRFIDYLPHYYLGLVYFNQQRQREALEELRKVTASGLLSEGDAEYRALSEMVEKAEASLAPKPEPARVTAEAPPRVAIEVPPKPSEPPREPDTPAPAIGATPITPRPRDPAPPPLPAPVQKRTPAGVPKDLQKAALSAFFSGQYEESARQLGEVAAGPGRTASALFYLGASHAALGLLNDEGRGDRLDQARRAFAAARRLDPRFEADPGLVSPRILRLWRESRP